MPVRFKVRKLPSFLLGTYTLRVSWRLAVAVAVAAAAGPALLARMVTEARPRMPRSREPTRSQSLLMGRCSLPIGSQATFGWFGRMEPFGPLRALRPADGARLAMRDRRRLRS